MSLSKFPLQILRIFFNILLIHSLADSLIQHATVSADPSTRIITPNAQLNKRANSESPTKVCERQFDWTHPRRACIDKNGKQWSCEPNSCFLRSSDGTTSHLNQKTSNLYFYGCEAFQKPTAARVKVYSYLAYPDAGQVGKPLLTNMSIVFDLLKEGLLSRLVVTSGLVDGVLIEKVTDRYQCRFKEGDPNSKRVGESQTLRNQSQP
ncbi:hypothetical protein O181_033766 [Austropuccinia psidii MF-1]|uniref:Uncharacterized protein n=1 Tax=Austropuccinia psidii MF-1 TaxID=1389203 RepID=A0A9Q3H7E1_9BASI|nr:hypothetical protein [Austropuccinia psidii MF-1]